MSAPAKGLAALLCLFAFVAALFALERPPLRAPVTLLLSGELRGRLEPCGCSKGLLGGLARRAAYVSRLRSEGRSVVLLDAGELSEGADRYAEVKLETALDLYGAMGYAALALGRAEAAFGAERVRALAADRGMAALGAGDVVSLPASRAPGAPRIGVLRLEDSGSASEALRERAGALRAAGGWRVVLLEGSVERADALAAAAPGAADLIVAGEGEDFPAFEPRRAGKTWIATYGALGKALGRVDLRCGASGACAAESAAWAPLGEEIPDDPAALRALALHQERLRAEALVERAPRTPDPVGAFAGSAACAACHAAAFQVWKSSRHAGALRTLERAERDADPGCVVCHVVGLERAGGFASRERTPALASVGCESCHGPGAAHAVGGPAQATRRGEATCLACHNAEHHPGFEFATAWPAIAHK